MWSQGSGDSYKLTASILATAAPRQPEEWDRNKMRVCAESPQHVLKPRGPGHADSNPQRALLVCTLNIGGAHPRLAVRLKEDDMGGGPAQSLADRGCQIPPFQLCLP